MRFRKTLTIRNHLSLALCACVVESAFLLLAPQVVIAQTSDFESRVNELSGSLSDSVQGTHWSGHIKGVRQCRRRMETGGIGRTERRA